MKRRELLGFLGGAVVAWPLAVCAQEQGRTYRLGSLHFSPRSAPHHVALFAELKRQGFIAGQNLWVDERGYGLHSDQLAEHAAELVKAQVDVIYCGGDANVRAAQQATQTIPIVTVSEDMVAPASSAHWPSPAVTRPGSAFCRRSSTASGRTS